MSAAREARRQERLAAYKARAPERLAAAEAKRASRAAKQNANLQHPREPSLALHVGTHKDQEIDRVRIARVRNAKTKRFKKKALASRRSNRG